MLLLSNQLLQAGIKEPLIVLFIRFKLDVKLATCEINLFAIFKDWKLFIISQVLIYWKPQTCELQHWCQKWDWNNEEKSAIEMDQKDDTSAKVATGYQEDENTLDQQATLSPRTAPQPTSIAWDSLAAQPTAAASPSRLPSMEAEAMQHPLLAVHSRIPAMDAEAIQHPLLPSQQRLSAWDSRAAFTPAAMPPHPYLPQPAMGKERYMKTCEYTGESSWRSYISQFERIAGINGWNVDMKRTHLWISLSGMALDFIDQLPTDKTCTYGEMCKVLDQRFGSERLATVYKAELKNRTRKSGESLSALAQEIWRLTRLAYPDFAIGEADEIAKEKFVDALPDATLRLKIHHDRPKTMEETVEIAIHHEAWTNTEEAKKHSHGRARGSRADEGVMKMLQELRNEMKAEIQELKGKTAGERTSWRDRKDIVCYNCNNKGHIAKFCPEKRKRIRERNHRRTDEDTEEKEMIPEKAPQRTGSDSKKKKRNQRKKISRKERN